MSQHWYNEQTKFNQPKDIKWN